MCSALKYIIFCLVCLPVFCQGTALAAPLVTAPKEAPPAVFDPALLPEKAPHTGSITVTDATGRNVTLDLPVSRYAVSTMDVIDYLIPVLGRDAFDKLVGTGQSGGKGIQNYSNVYTPIVGNYAGHLCQISEHHAPFDLEMLLTVDPDVLIVNSAMGAHMYALAIEKQLARAGIKLILIDVPGKSCTTSSQATLKLIGRIFQEEKRAAEVVDFLDRQFAPLKSDAFISRKDKPTVYYEMSRSAASFGPTQTSVSNGWGAVIKAAGGKNIADKVLLETGAAKGSGNTLDPEYVLQADPQFVILSAFGWMGNLPDHPTKPPGFDLVNRTGWDRMQAVKNRNIYALAHDLNRSVMNFYACRKLAAVFYPDLAAQLDPEAAMETFFKRFMLADSSITVWSWRYKGESGH